MDATLTGAPVEPAAGSAAGVARVAAGGVVIRLGVSRFSVPMADVAEVTPVPGVTRLPGTPAWLAGVANWRGRILPVLDLRPLLGTATGPLPTSARLVVLSRGDLVAGLLAEAVPGVQDAPLPDAGLEPAPATLAADAARLVTGQVRDRAGPVAVLDTGAVLALRERVDRRRHGA